MITPKNQDFAGILALITLELKTGRKKFEDQEEERQWELITHNAIASFIYSFGDPGDYVDLREFMRVALMKQFSLMTKKQPSLYVDAAANRDFIEDFYKQSHQTTSIFGKEKQRKTKISPKVQAVGAVNGRIAKGKMQKASTLKCGCGAQAQNYHHWSYDRKHWFDVIPMCDTCHGEVHRRIRTALKPHSIDPILNEA